MAGFFERVYRLVRRIPPGRVTSYGAIARLLGCPHAARSVGWALHSLPPSVPSACEGDERGDVPWHRVVNRDGGISLAGWEGGRLQRALLEAEGVEFRADGRVDMERFGWTGLAPDADAQRGG